MRIHPGFRRRALVAALSAIYGSLPLWVQANPTGAQVVNGQASFQTQGSKLTVTNTPGTIINWQGFSIGKGETTHFQQQSAASSVLNRVGMQNAAAISKIEGTLSSNGRVFLINPNGIVFGAGSVVDTQGLVASTLSLSDDDFKSGKLRFARQGAAGDIQAQGRISVGTGDVFLLAPNIGVDGSAVIQSSGGNIVLAAGEAIEITGRNLNDITFAVQNTGNEVLNLGHVSGGAVGLFAGSLRHSGVVQAQTLAREGGKLVLKASGNVTLGVGSIAAADGSSRGGDVSIVSTGGNVVADQGSRVSADALNPAVPGQAEPAGGKVLVSAAAGLAAIEQSASVQANGGVGGTVLVAAERVLQSGAVRADGSHGHGGTVSVQGAQRVLQTQGAITSATGAMHGGSVTVSTNASADGSAHLFTSGTLDASAAGGVGGSVVLSGRELVLAGAHLRADGDAGGGSIRVGGGRAGQDASVPNATNVTVTAASVLSANARVDGDGGTAITWSDGVTKFAGVVEARGGAVGGNGGFIEVSGKLETQFAGTPNASAPNGLAGSFLLDPKFITIQAPTLGSGQAVELLDPNPGAGDFFGSSLQSFLSDTRIVVLNSQDDLGGTNAGAVYLFDGVSGALISHLRGSTANDQIGNFGLSQVSGNTYVVRSPNWTNALAPTSPANAGAMTWFDVSTGVSGVVSSANSLVGNSAGDSVGSASITTHGAMRFVLTPNWNSGSGAFTRLDPLALPVGSITASNSLIGSPGDQIGSNGVYNLFGGYSLMFSNSWGGGKGAVTWINQASGLTGLVDPTNSLVGSTAGDAVGSGFWQYFGNRIAIVSSTWNNGGSIPNAGALTWASSSTPLVGAVGVGNSLVGDHANDRVGNYGSDGGGTYGLIDLGFLGGGYKGVVRVPGWNSGAGAVTWVDANAPVVGAVSAANSLVGASPGDGVGSAGVRVLSNGNYVTLSPGATINALGSAGAVTWSSGLGGPSTVGVVSDANSFVGTHANDQVGNGTFLDLNSGAFAVLSSSWNGGAGAVTWGNGFAPLIGSPADAGTAGGNSIYGASPPPSQIGNGGLTTLNNGNFIVFSPNHSTGLIDLGAVTIGDQNTGFLGGTAPVSNLNSIVGVQAGDQVGANRGSNFFDRGNYYLLRTPTLKGTAGAVNAGAVTWLNGTPVAGDITTLSGLNGNTIHGTTAGDNVGSQIDFPSSGNFVVRSPNWANTPSVPNAGAVTFGHSSLGFESDGRTAGPITALNSLVGTSTGDQVGSGGIIDLQYTGHYLILSPNYAGGAGAVTWSSGYNAASGTIAASVNSNSIYGSLPADAIGSGGITFLDYYYGGGYNYGHFVVVSPAAASNLGAVTWGSEDIGFSTPGAVTTLNSLMGTTPGDQLGSGGIQVLYNPLDYHRGNYLVLSPNHDSSGGAVTWASGTAPVKGTIGAEVNGNSIFGLPGDQVGSDGIQILNNRNFVVLSSVAGNPVTGATFAGGVTFGRHDTGFASSTVISPGNSLMGSSNNDRVGVGGVVALYDQNDFTQSNYLVLSPFYRSGGGANALAGAVTWASGTLPIAGEIGSETHGNSIFGATANDNVGSSIQVLGNGNFVVRSPGVDIGPQVDAGAVSFGNQGSGFTAPGAVSSSNSLVGSASADAVGTNSVQEFGSNNFAVRTPTWNGGTGAVTWGNNLTGVTGVVGAGNSLVGAAAGDNVGASSLVSVASGYYLRSGQWAGNKGAITYINPASPEVGVVGGGNSLVGLTVGDNIGSSGVTYFGNNRIGVFSADWRNGAATNAGAVTWLDASTARSGFVGSVNAGNSLVGTTTNDFVGGSGAQFVGGTLYALRDSSWHNGAAANAGAITWMDTAKAAPIGAVGASNSLVGSNTNDFVGSGTTFVQGPGYLLVRNGNWNGNRGALTWMTAAAPAVGAISSSNSLVGANANEQIGNGGIYANSSFYLANGDYVVVSPSVSGGAVTIGSASGGISGVVSAANSQIGFGTGINFVNNRSRLRMVNSSATSNNLLNAGRICLYSGGAGCPSSAALGSQLYNDNAASGVTITPSQILAILNAGTNVTLQASTDITLGSGSDILVNNPSGNGGTLTLQAGRSVLLNSSITTDNGNLMVIANDRVANGVQAANRDAGTAEITMADGTRIDAGTGSVVFQLRDGLGHSGASTANGIITLRSINAANLDVQTDFGGIQVGSPGAGAPSLIKLTGDAFFKASTTILFAGGGAGAPAELSADGQITIDPPTLEMRTGGSYARIVNPTQLFPLDITVAECITCVNVSPFEITGISSSIPELVVGLLGATGGGGGGVDLDPLGKKQEEEIVVDTGDTCK